MNCDVDTIVVKVSANMILENAYEKKFPIAVIPYSAVRTEYVAVAEAPSISQVTSTSNIPLIA